MPPTPAAEPQLRIRSRAPNPSGHRTTGPRPGSTPGSTSIRSGASGSWGEILEHVTARLGTDLEMVLEIQAANPEGYDDATQRIVSENAANLGVRYSEFE